MSTSHHFEVLYQTDAEKDLSKIDKRFGTRIANVIDALAFDPRPQGAVRLKGIQGLWRIRVGDYRVIYEIKDRQLIVLVVRINHRREVYRGL